MSPRLFSNSDRSRLAAPIFMKANIENADKNNNTMLLFLSAFLYFTFSTVLLYVLPPFPGSYCGFWLRRSYGRPLQRLRQLLGLLRD